MGVMRICVSRKFAGIWLMLKSNRTHRATKPESDRVTMSKKTMMRVRI